MSMDNVSSHDVPSISRGPNVLRDQGGESQVVFRDRFNREIRTLRISVTDRCNFRCLYCMPHEDTFFKFKEEILSFEEITRIAKIFAAHGIRKIRFTGGEPTVRKDLPKLISQIREETMIKNLAITTNGSRLTELSQSLHDAGIQTVNISLDTLQPKKFKKITQRDLFDRTMQGIETAIHTGFKRIKINVVGMRSFNFDEVYDFIEFALNKKVTVRFIEFMPFTGNDWERQELIPSRVLREHISKKYDLEALNPETPSQTSVEYMINGDPQARVGFISSVTESFCSSCDRVRLTADGKLRPCLHSAFERDLRRLLRQGATNEEIAQVIQETIWQKSKGHENFLNVEYKPPENDREMMRIGG